MQTSIILSIATTSATDAQTFVTEKTQTIQQWWADGGKEQTKTVALWLWGVAQTLAFIIVVSTMTVGICLFRVAQALWQNRSTIKANVSAYTFNIWACIGYHATLFFDRYVWPIGDVAEVLIWGV